MAIHRDGLGRTLSPATIRFESIMQPLITRENNPTRPRALLRTRRKKLNAHQNKNLRVFLKGKGVNSQLEHLVSI